MANVSIVERPTFGEIMETVIIKGDLGQLTPEERAEYYTEVCKSAGLNPLTRPFDYIVLEGKLTLYARKDCTDQLRKLNGVSIEIVSRDLTDDLYTVHVRAKDRHGREDEDMGAVVMVYPAKVKRNGNWVDHPLAHKPLKGVDRANALMKAVTKAKRRVTLSISGLGFPDETEVEDILSSAADPKPKGDTVAPPKRGEKRALPPVVGEKPEPIQEPTVEDAEFEEASPESDASPDVPEDDHDIIISDFAHALAPYQGNATRVNQLWRRYERDFESFDAERMRKVKQMKARACLPANKVAAE